VTNANAFLTFLFLLCRRTTDTLGWWLETWPEFWYQRLMITLLVVGPLSMSLLLFWYHLTRMTDFGKTVLNVVGLVVDMSVLTWIGMAVWKHPNVDLPEWPIEVDQEKQKLRKLKEAMKRLPVTAMTPKKDELAQRYLANLLQLCKDKIASSIAELSEEQKEEAMIDAHAGWLVDQLKKAKEIEAQELQPVKAEVEKALLELEEDGNSSADDEDGDLPTSLSSPSQSSTAARAASEFQEIHIPLRKKAYYFIPFAIVVVLVRLLLGALAVIIFSIASPAEKVHWVPLAYLIAWTTFTGVFFGNHLADLFVIWRRITAKYIDYLLEQNPVKRYKKVHPPKLMTIFVRELDRWCHYHRHFLKAPYLMILPLVYGFVFAGELASKWNSNGVVFVDTFVFFSDLGLFVSIVIILVFQCFITTELHRLAGYFMTLATSIKEHQLERRHWQSYYLRSFNSNSLPISPTTLATMSSLLVPLLTVGIVSGFRIYFMPSTAAGCCKCTNATAIDI